MNDDMVGVLYIVSGTKFYRVRFPGGAPAVDMLGDVGTANAGSSPWN